MFHVFRLRLKASTSATSVHAKQVKPVQAEDSDQHAAKKRRVQAQVKQSTPKPNTAEKAVSPPKSNADTDLEIAKRALLAEYVGTATPHSASSASSSSSVSSSSASSSDSDSDSDSSATFEPKRIPSHTTQRQSSAAISQRRRSTSGSSSEPSSSADTSSSDDSNDPPPTAQKQFPLRSADTTGNASHDVPPGAGQAKTKARNQRKRKRRLLLKAAERSVADAKTGVPLPAVADQPAHPPGQIPVNAQAATPRPVKAVAAAAATPSTIVDTARGLVETVTEQSELHKGMTSAAALSSNKNKAKSLKRDRAKGLRQHGTKLVFNATGNVEGTPVVSQATIQYADMSNAHVGAPLRVATPAKDPAEYENYTPQSPRHDNDVDETADMDLEKDDSAASATYTAHPTPQRAVIGPSVTPAAKVAIAKSAPRSLPRQVPMQPAPPSMRRHQMPSNVLVTSTDVERDDFVPGQPQPDFQISSKALAYYKESLQASSTQNDASSLLSNISQPAIGPAVPVVGPIASKPAAKAPITTVQWHASASSTVQASGSIYSGTTSSKSGAQLSDTIDWTGWPTSVSEVMRKFTTYTQISNAPGEGECVAMRVGILLRSDRLIVLTPLCHHRPSNCLRTHTRPRSRTSMVWFSQWVQRLTRAL